MLAGHALHLRTPGFTYSACVTFTKHREKIQEFKEIGDLNYIYKNELDKGCFAHDAAYSDSKNLAKRTILDTILKNKIKIITYKIAVNVKYDGYQRWLASMVYRYFDKKTGLGEIETSKAGASVNEELVQELDKPVIKKIKRKKLYARKIIFW